MKKLTIIYYLIFFTSSMTSFMHAENMLTKVRDYFYTTRLFAGYHSSPEEKAAAREKIKQLSTERDNLQNSLEMIIDDEQEKQAILTKIAEINKQIYERKIILGQEMTGTRKLFWLGTGLLGLAALSKAEYEIRGLESYSYKIKEKIEKQWLLLKYHRLTLEELRKELKTVEENARLKNIERTTAKLDEAERLNKEVNKLEAKADQIKGVINQRLFE